jgi:hypothetical protein
MQPLDMGSQPLDILNEENVFKLLPGSLGTGSPGTLEELRDKGVVEVSRVMLLRDPENWRRNPVFQALSRTRGRKPYFLGEDGVFKQDVIRYVVARRKYGWPVASICRSIYHNPAFKRFDWARGRWEPLRLTVKTVLKWLYLYGLVKPGIPLVQRILRRRRKREERREKEVYEKGEQGFRRFLAIAMDVLGMGWVDAAVYWMQLNSD